MLHHHLLHHMLLLWSHLVVLSGRSAISHWICSDLWHLRGDSLHLLHLLYVIEALSWLSLRIAHWTRSDVRHLRWCSGLHLLDLLDLLDLLHHLLLRSHPAALFWTSTRIARSTRSRACHLMWSCHHLGCQLGILSRRSRVSQCAWFDLSHLKRGLTLGWGFRYSLLLSFADHTSVHRRSNGTGAQRAYDLEGMVQQGADSMAPVWDNVLHCSIN